MKPETNQIVQASCRPAEPHKDAGSPVLTIDLLKIVAAQLIVLHHLAFYGPMADNAHSLAPALFKWLASDARIAVQVFLVVGGFLAAKSLDALHRGDAPNALGVLLRRYLKLAPPFVAASAIAIGASALARTWMTHDSISAPAGVSQFLAHALLVHSILGYESLSAGAWYVAIDLQLFAIMVFVHRAARRFARNQERNWLLPAILTAGIGASLLHFNRQSEWDNWAPYFFGSYGLGAMAWLAANRASRSHGRLLLIAAMLVTALIALAVDFRSRIALALLVACILLVSVRFRPDRGSGFARATGAFGRTAYAIFLIHFPVCLIVNAIFVRFFPLDPAVQAAGVLTAWITSLASGAAFHNWIEQPLSRLALLSGKRLALIPPSARDG